MITHMSTFTNIHTWLTSHQLARRWMIGIFIWALSVLLLFPTLGAPRGIVFDETYYIPRAQRYLNHVFFVTDDHPPLGQMMIALGQFVLHPDSPSDEFVNESVIKRPWPENSDITGYRLFPAIFGTFLALLIFLISLQITQNDWCSAFIGLAVVFDNALVTQSHFALTDSALLFFCFSTILCYSWLQNQKKKIERKTYLVWILYGVCASAASLVKLTGLFAMISIPFYLYKMFMDGHRQNILKFILIFSITFTTIFLIVWQTHFSILTKFDPNSNYEISNAQRQILEGKSDPNPIERFRIQITDTYQSILHFHENIGPLDLNKPDEIGSAWYQWPIGGRSIPYRWSTSDFQIQIIYLIGNPAVWIISLLGVIGGVVMLITQLIKRSYSIYFKWYLSLIGMYLVYMVTMAMVTRVMYLYHYLPPMLIGVILFSLVFLELPISSSRTKAEFLFLAAIWIIVSFWVYSPFTYNTPLSYTQFELRDVWSPWKLQIP